MAPNQDAVAVDMEKEVCTYFSKSLPSLQLDGDSTQLWRMATAKKPPASHKRLRTCSTSCPDLSNPEAGVFTKLYVALV